jgi:hypothetical protein
MADEAGVPLPSWHRQAIFQVLVETLWSEGDLPRARSIIAERFGTDEPAVRLIEEEGLGERWPPLG